MKRFVRAAVLVAIGLGAAALAGCNRSSASLDGGPGARGRYVGVGIYSPGEIWEQLARASVPKDAAAATLDDDDEIIVVMDSATGELRQCGNLSGHCIAFNPWAKPIGSGQDAPVRLQKHARQLAEEAKAEAEKEAASDTGIELEIRPRWGARSRGVEPELDAAP